MEWLALSLAFVAIIFFTVHYPGFRRGIAGLAAVLIVLTIVVVAATSFYSWVQEFRTEARRQAASNLIRPEQIGLSDPKLTLGTSPNLSATILNKSKYDLAELEIRILLSDCPSPSRDDSISEKEWDEFINSAPKPQESKTTPRTGMFDDLIPKKPVKRSSTAGGMFDDLPDLTRSPTKADGNARQGSQCGIVGEYVAVASALRVPKGQKRALKTPVHFADLPTLTEWSWRYSIDKAIAKYQ
ncbi:hypothetical protein AMST5_02796 [freshwater sediment metagenome]|uniref:Uncharacterized protein n=1 Tax=freshwater sediment metagenome TaxID=556182 RepID=A0AA48M430_9ZZZZ